jgi:gliding motility-associated-like protein
MWAQQSLVPNGSFEEYYQCPTAPGSVGDDQLERCKFWYKATSGTADYYNSCQTNANSGASVPSNWLGYQQPFEGNAYVGIGVYIPGSANCEYIQCKLASPLQPCQMYKFSMRVSLSDFSSRATKTLGVRFDVAPIKKTPPMVFAGFELPSHIEVTTPITDTSNWILFEGDYIAEGGEEYLTIGRFIDTNFYSNFNFPVIEVVCDSCFDPHDAAYYYVDSITLIATKDAITERNIPNILTANNDHINDFWYPFKICFKQWKCEIFNRWGNPIFEFQEGASGWLGADFSGNTLPDGVYFYKVYNENEFKTGFIQLIR